MNTVATEIAKVLYNNMDLMYLNSTDPVEKSFLSECLDELGSILQFSPNRGSVSMAEKCLEFLSHIYTPTDLANFYIERKSAELTETKYSNKDRLNFLRQNTWEQRVKEIVTLIDV